MWVGMKFSWKGMNRVDEIIEVSDFPYQFRYRHTSQERPYESTWLSMLSYKPHMVIPKQEYIKRFKELYGKV